MFPRRIIGMASLPLALGLATDALAQRRPGPPEPSGPPPAVVYDTPVPERYQIAEQEVLARLREPPPPPVVVEPVRQETTVVIRHEEPVERYYGRRRCDPPPLPPPRVVYVEPPPRVVYVEPPCPPRRPVYVCPPPRPVYECRPTWWDRPRCDSGFSFSLSIGDDWGHSRFRYRDRDDCRPRGRHRR